MISTRHTVECSGELGTDTVHQLFKGGLPVVLGRAISIHNTTMLLEKVTHPGYLDASLELRRISFMRLDSGRECLNLTRNLANVIQRLNQDAPYPCDYCR